MVSKWDKVGKTFQAVISSLKKKKKIKLNNYY